MEKKLQLSAANRDVSAFTAAGFSCINNLSHIPTYTIPDVCKTRHQLRMLLKGIKFP